MSNINFFKNHPEYEQIKFNKHIAYQNYTQLKKFIIPILVSTIIMFILSFILNDKNNIIIINEGFLVVCFITSILLYSSDIHNYSEIKFKHHLIVYVFIFFSFIWAIALVTNNPNRIVTFVDLLIVTILVGTLVYTKWQYLISLYSLSFLSLLIFTPYTNTSILEIAPLFTAYFIFLILSLYVSRTIYTQNLDNFETIFLLEKSNNNLVVLFEQKTKELTLLTKTQANDIIYALANVLDCYDTYTVGHSKGVATLSQDFAVFLNLPAHQINDIYWAGMIHDIGKVQIPRTILNKTTPLTDKEYGEIKKHPINGYNVLKNSKHLSEISKIVRYHHERWDGNGYPSKLKKDAIPFESQILSIADSYDAMTSRRVYRAALTRKKAIIELRDNINTQFSSYIVEKFLEFLDIHKK